jgi:hypothetical protein
VSSGKPRLYISAAKLYIPCIVIYDSKVKRNVRQAEGLMDKSDSQILQELQ